MHLTPVKQVTVEPGCLLPENFTGNSSDHSELDREHFVTLISNIS
jgi:hypothetical protein